MEATIGTRVPAPTRRRLGVDDILPTSVFADARIRLRPLVSEMRRRRRVRLEPHCTVAFENRETVLWQIQEVLRVESKREPHQVRHELDQYDAILPRPGELRATVLIDGGPEDEAERLSLDLASGAATLELQVGPRICSAECVEEHPSMPDPVRYVRLPVGAAGIQPLQLANLPVRLRVLGSGHEARLSPDTCRALATDLWVEEVASR